MYSDSIIISTPLHSLFKNIFRQWYLRAVVVKKRKRRDKQKNLSRRKSASNSFTSKSELSSHEQTWHGSSSFATVFSYDRMKIRKLIVRESWRPKFEIVIESPFISLRIRDREGPIRYRSRSKGMKREKKRET